MEIPALECFWISTPWTLDAKGSYEVRFVDAVERDAIRKTLYKVELRNMNMNYRLTDYVDANSFNDYDWEENSWAWGAIECTYGDYGFDKIQGAAFEIEVYFEKSEQGVLSKSFLLDWQE